MISPKRLLAVLVAKKWQKFVAKQQKRISFPGGLRSSLANKGHFVVYTTDDKRFEFPLECLRRSLFVELLRISEEEFGLPTDGPITLPCESLLLEYIISLVNKGYIAEDLEKTLLITYISIGHCSVSSSHDSIQPSQNQMLNLGF